MNNKWHKLKADKKRVGLENVWKKGGGRFLDPLLIVNVQFVPIGEWDD